MSRNTNNLNAAARRRLAMVVGIRITAARIARRWSQSELATRTGRSRAHIANVEGGNVALPLEQVYVLARALNMPLTRLLPSVTEVFDD